MAELSPKARQRIFDTVLGEIEPSRLRIYGKTGLAVALGGILSLVVCGQFGVGMTSLAEHIHHGLQRHFGSLVCALACGVFFAALPVLVLRLLCRAVEFRAITRKGKYAPVIWLLGLGGALALHGDHGKEFIELAAWAIAAVATFKIVSMGFDRAIEGRARLAV